jgi:hypothetical protein
VDDAGGWLLAGGRGQLGLRFAGGSAHGDAMNRLHLHLTDGVRSQRDTIAACLALGATLRGSGKIPENDCVYMADVVADEFCVIEDGNGYLTGCGPLGEVTIAGSREVGRFWSEALGWPLVWEVGDERVIQSPLGGTKVAWGGEPVAAPPEKGRQYFVFTVPAAEFDDEVKRLISLGAFALSTDASGETTLRDPDGTAFVLRGVGRSG